MKILIVEDDFVSAEIIKKIMEKFGECTIVENGIASISAFTSAINNGQIFDLIIHDIELPTISGIDAITIIRQIEKLLHNLIKEKTKIIVMSVHSDKKNVVGCFKAGCDKYLVKPVNEDKVIDVLKSLGIKVS